MTKVASLLVAGLAIAGTICCLSSVQCADEPKRPNSQQKLPDTLPQYIEQELAKWKPDHEDLSPTIKDIFRPKADIAGDWTTDVFFDASSLSIRKTKSGGYSVDLSTGGCLGNWDLHREGTYTGGILRLKKPVEEYRPHTYDTLYLVAVNGKEYLISQSAIRFVMKYYSNKGVVDWSEHISFSAFHRKDKAGDKKGKTDNDVSK